MNFGKLRDLLLLHSFVFRLFSLVWLVRFSQTRSRGERGRLRNAISGRRCTLWGEGGGDKSVCMFWQNHWLLQKQLWKIDLKGSAFKINKKKFLAYSRRQLNEFSVVIIWTKYFCLTEILDAFFFTEAPGLQNKLNRLKNGSVLLKPVKTAAEINRNNSTVHRKIA